MPKKRPLIQFKGFGGAADPDPDASDHTSESPVPGKSRVSRHYGTDDGHHHHHRRRHHHHHHHHRHRDDDDDDDDDDADRDPYDRYRRDGDQRGRQRDDLHPDRHRKHRQRHHPDRPKTKHKEHRHRHREAEPDPQPDADRDLDQQPRKHKHHHPDRTPHHRDDKHRHRSRSRSRPHRSHDPNALDDERYDELALENKRRHARARLDPREEDDDGEEEEEVLEDQRRSHSRRSRTGDDHVSQAASGRKKYPYEREDLRDHGDRDAGQDYGYERTDYRSDHHSSDGRARGRRTSSQRASRNDHDNEDENRDIPYDGGGSHRSRSRSQSGTRKGTHTVPPRGDGGMRTSHWSRHSARSGPASHMEDGYPDGTHVSDETEEPMRRPNAVHRSPHQSGISRHPYEARYMGQAPGFAAAEGMRRSVPHPLHGSHPSIRRSALAGGAGMSQIRGPPGIEPRMGPPQSYALGPPMGTHIRESRIDPHLSRPGPGYHPPGLADDGVIADEYAARVRRNARHHRRRRKHHGSRKHRRRRHSKHRKHRHRGAPGSESRNGSDEDNEGGEEDNEEQGSRRQKASRSKKTEDEKSERGSNEGSEDDDDETESDGSKKGKRKKSMMKAGLLALLAVGTGLLVKKAISSRKKKKQEQAENSGYMSDGSDEATSAGGQAYFRPVSFRPRIPPVSLFGVKVPQNQVCIVERGGRYHRKLNAGSNFLTPCVDKVAYCHSLKEMAMPVPWQQCFTSDRIPLRANGMLYVRIEDPVAASYDVDNPYDSIILLAQTCIRNEIGRLTKQRAFQARVEISDRILDEINDTCRPWGVRCLKFELRDMELPLEIREKLEAEEEAERQKHFAIMQSEAERVTAINKAEAELQAQMKASQARQLEIVNEAIGEAHAIQERGEAVASALRDVAEVVNEPGGQQAMQMRLAERFIDAYAKASSGPVVPPPDPNNVASNMNNAMEFLNTLSQDGQAPQIPLQPLSPNPFSIPATGSENSHPNVQSGSSSPQKKPKPIEAPPNVSNVESAAKPQQSEKPSQHLPPAPNFYPQPAPDQPSGSRMHASKPQGQDTDDSASDTPDSGQTKQRPLKKLQALVEKKVDQFLH